MGNNNTHVHRIVHTYSCNGYLPNRSVYYQCTCKYLSAEGVGWHPTRQALKRAVEKKNKKKSKQNNT